MADRDAWARFRDGAAGVFSVLSGLAAVAVPIVAIYIGNDFAAAMKDRDLEARVLELAVEVLRDEPSPETQSLRRWAIETIDESSIVELPEAAKEELTRFPSVSLEITGLSEGYCRDLIDRFSEDDWGVASLRRRIVECLILEHIPLPPWR